MDQKSVGEAISTLCFTLQASRFVSMRFRRILLRTGGAQIGPGAQIRSGCEFWGQSFSVEGSSFINRDCYFDLTASITIHRHVALGFGVSVVTGTHEVGPHLKRAGDIIGLPVIIEDGCWIGARVTIMPGVTVARGCVIGTGAVVTRSTEPNGVYAGIPASRLRSLNEAEGTSPVPTS